MNPLPRCRPRTPATGPEIRRVAVFRALQLGDMLCAVPALRALRAGLPEARITLAGLPWAADFARRFADCVDDFVAFPGHPALPEQAARAELLPAFYRSMRSHRLDLAVQLHGDGRISNGIVRRFGARLMAGFAPAGGAAARCGRFLAYPDAGHESERLSGLVHALGLPRAAGGSAFPLLPGDFSELAASGLAAGLVPGNYLCLHPGARSADRRWPAACFAEVGERLASETGLAVVLTGSGNERELAAGVARRMQAPVRNAAAPVSIGAMAALLSGARLLVCNDTGVSHIAAGLGLPSVVIFSNSDMDRWAPPDTGRHAAVRDPAGTRVAAVLAQARRLLEDIRRPWPGPAPAIVSAEGRAAGPL